MAGRLQQCVQVSLQRGGVAKNRRAGQFPGTFVGGKALPALLQAMTGAGDFEEVVLQLFVVGFHQQGGSVVCTLACLQLPGPLPVPCPVGQQGADPIQRQCPFPFAEAVPDGAADPALRSNVETASDMTMQVGLGQTSQRFGGYLGQPCVAQALDQRRGQTVE